MTQSQREEFVDPKDKDGLVSESASEDGAGTRVATNEADRTEPVELDIADPHFLANAYDTYADLDRKSTRLNSSHANISYAVFCLKKKKYHISGDVRT